MSDTGDYVNGPVKVFCDKVGEAVSVRPLGFLEILDILENVILDAYYAKIKKYLEMLTNPEAQVQYVITAQREEPAEDELYRQALIMATTADGQHALLLKGLDICNPGLGISSEKIFEDMEEDKLEDVRKVIFKQLKELSKSVETETEDEDEELDEDGEKKPEPEAKPEKETEPIAST